MLQPIKIITSGKTAKSLSTLRFVEKNLAILPVHLRRGEWGMHNPQASGAPHLLYTILRATSPAPPVEKPYE